MLRRSPLLPYSLAWVALLAGCGEMKTEPFPPPVPGELIKSEKERVLSPQIPAADLKALTRGNGDLAFDLYRLLRAKPGNLFFSPHSISTAVAMLHAGARGNTERQIARSMHFSLPQDRLHPANNALDLALASRGKGRQAADGKAFRLEVVNATWGQKGYAFLSGFLDTLGQSYGAGMRLLDFGQDAEGSRKQINAWVERKTEGRIDKLLPKGSVSDKTRLVLTNAIYFNAAWQHPFDKGATRSASFATLSGKSVKIPTMEGQFNVGFVADGDVKAAELPYDGDELAMLIIVPDAGKFAAVEQQIDRAMVDGLSRKLRQRAVALALPRFRVKTRIDLAQHFKKLGMVDVFDSGRADLSGIDGTRQLYVSGIFHKAFVNVDEAGTEAAAATGIVVGRSSVAEPASLKVDRPFIYLIRDRQTGAILFVGRVVDPS